MDRTRTGTSTSKVGFAITTVVLFCAMGSAHAGRPMIVDDAGITAPNSCQLESWVHNSSGGSEYWAVPACNFVGNLEVALGGARFVGASQTGNVAALQGKMLLRPLTDNGWGVALLVGTQSVLAHGGIGDVFATVPVSFSFRNSRVVLHANAGILRVKSSRRIHGTWGAGVEAAVDGRVTAGRKAVESVRIKYWLTKDRVQRDATYGNRVGSGSTDRFVMLGLVLFTNGLD